MKTKTTQRRYAIAVFHECASSRRRRPVVVDPQQVFELEQSGNRDCTIYVDTTRGHLEFAQSCANGDTQWLRAVAKGILEGLKEGTA